MKKLVLAVVAAIGGAAATIVFTQAIAGTDTYRQLNLFGDVFERVKNDYVRETKDAELVESAINGMLNGLDPHSSYLNPKNFSDMQVSTRGTSNCKMGSRTAFGILRMSKSRRDFDPDAPMTWERS